MVAGMGRRFGLVTQIAEDVVSAGVATFALAGLVPLLWEHDGWSGIKQRTGSLLPLAVGFAVFGPIGRRWRARRHLRRLERRQAVGSTH